MSSHSRSALPVKLPLNQQLQSSYLVVLQTTRITPTHSSIVLLLSGFSIIEKPKFPWPSMQKGKVYTEGTPAFLPSSLTNIDPDALGFSPHPPVSVYGTSTILHNYDDFLGTLVRANSRCQVSSCFRDYRITLHLLRGSNTIHRICGFACKPTLRAEQR